MQKKKSAAVSGHAPRKRPRKDRDDDDGFGQVESLVGKSIWETYCRICRQYSSAPCVGTLNDSHGYNWLSYSAFMERVVTFGSGLSTFLNPRDFVAICSPNRYLPLVIAYIN